MPAGVSKVQLVNALGSYTKAELMEFCQMKDQKIAALKTYRDALLFYIGAKKKRIHKLERMVARQRTELAELKASSVGKPATANTDIEIPGPNPEETEPFRDADE